MPDPTPASNRHSPSVDPLFPDGVGNGTPAPPQIGAAPAAGVVEEPAPVATPDAGAAPVEPAAPTLDSSLTGLVDPPPAGAAVPPVEGEPTDVSKLMERLDNRQSTIDRQGAELGDLRGDVRDLRALLEAQVIERAAAQEPESTTKFDMNLAVSDPEYMANYLKTEIDKARQQTREDVMREVTPALAPLVQLQAANRVAESNPLAEAALGNKHYLARIQEISRDASTLRERYSGKGENLEDLRLKAAIFDVVGERWKDQKAARTVTREEIRANRDESAGAGSLRGGPSPPSAGEEESLNAKVAKMSPTEGAKFFSQRFAARRYGAPTS